MEGWMEGGREGGREGRDVPLVHGARPLCLLLANFKLDVGRPSVVIRLPLHPPLEDLPG